jgi:hypothetical protein
MKDGYFSMTLRPEGRAEHTVEDSEFSQTEKSKDEQVKVQNHAHGFFFDKRGAVQSDLFSQDKLSTSVLN